MSLFDWLLPGSTSLDPEIEQGAERLIQTVDSRLKAVSHAIPHLAPAIGTALDFCRRTVSQVPGPMDAAPGAWQKSPELHALFARADELQLVFSRQASMQDYAQSHPGTPVIHAMLGAVLQERRGFGVTLSQGTLQHDAAVTTLNFQRHQLYMPSTDQESLDQALIWALFDQLGLELRQQLEAMRTSRDELQEEIALLRTHLAHVEYQGLGRLFCGSGEEDSPRESCNDLTDRLNAELEARTQALESSRQQLRTLDDTLDWIIATLSRPELLIPVKPLHYRIDGVNQVVSPNQPGQDLNFCHFSFSAPHPRQGVLMRITYPVADLLPRQTITQNMELGLG